MSTESERASGATFEEVDWDSVQTSGLDMSTREIVQAGALLVWLLCVIYSYVIGDGTFLGLGSLDWLLILTLLLGVFNVVWPLAENRRMTAYYWRQFRKNKAAMVSLAYLAVLFVVGIVGPFVMKQPTQDFGAMLHPPVGFTAAPNGTPIQGSWAHPLGTTQQGKDILTLVVYGTQVSLKVGLIGMVVLISIGTAVGTTAAYFGGWVDELLMRYVDVQQTFPAFMLLLLCVYLFGGSLFIIILLFGFLSWEGTARLVRSEALQRREESYIQAAENAGASESWIIRRHLVPNVSSTVVTAATLVVPGFILSEATLSFLGLGDPNVYSWGQVIASGRSSLATAPWIATIPGLLLFTTILAINFVGDALRDALDPRQEN